MELARRNRILVQRSLAIRHGRSIFSIPKVADAHALCLRASDAHEIEDTVSSTTGKRIARLGAR